MDPLSITASCIGITAGIATLTERITAFVSSVREARKDLDAVRRELGSLQLSLSALSDEDGRFGFDRTPQLKENLLGVMGHCGGIVGEIGLVFEGMEGEDGKMGVSKKLKWAASGKGQMAKLRLGLEAHKSALDIALDLIAISITADIKQDTSTLREDTEKIKEDTDQILQEIGNLKTQVSQLDVSHDRGFMMKRFLESSVSYAESVANLDEFVEEVDVLDNVPEEPSTHLPDIPARPEPPILQKSQNIPPAGPAPFSHPEQALSPGSRSSNRYWSSLPQKERDALLFEAAYQGNLKRISLLLDSGANIDAKNEAGETPLCAVIDRKYHSCLQLLLDNGASTYKIGLDYFGRNAFAKAEYRKDRRSMKMIIDSGPKNSEFRQRYDDLLMIQSDADQRKRLRTATGRNNFEPKTDFVTRAEEKRTFPDGPGLDVNGSIWELIDGKYERLPARQHNAIRINSRKQLGCLKPLHKWRWTANNRKFATRARFLLLEGGLVHLGAELELEGFEDAVFHTDVPFLNLSSLDRELVAWYFQFNFGSALTEPAAAASNSAISAALKSSKPVKVDGFTTNNEGFMIPTKGRETPTLQKTKEELKMETGEIDESLLVTNHFPNAPPPPPPPRSGVTGTLQRGIPTPMQPIQPIQPNNSLQSVRPMQQVFRPIQPKSANVQFILPPRQQPISNPRSTHANPFANLFSRNTSQSLESGRKDEAITSANPVPSASRRTKAKLAVATPQNPFGF